MESSHFYYSLLVGSGSLL